MTEDLRTDPELLGAAPATPRTPSVFGVVVEGSRRRRPGDIVRVGLAALVVVITALGADDVTALERQWFRLVAELPAWLRSSGELAYRLGSVGTVVVILVALLATRRWRLFAAVGGSGAIGFLLAIGLRSLLDLEQIRQANGMVLDGSIPEYPVVALACSTTVMLVVAPYLLRPARRMVFGLLAIASLGAIMGVVGLLDDVAASLALGWGVAAAFHLAIGTPAATPSRDQVADALAALGVSVSALELAPTQIWGTTRFHAVAPNGDDLSIEVIGRDATDARLFSKLGHALWYRDPGPGLALTRHQQLEHQAYVLLLAQQAGVAAGEVVIAGIGGAQATAVLVSRERNGTPLAELAPDAVTDPVLDQAWATLLRLHRARLAHGQVEAGTVCLLPDGTIGLTDFARASAAVPVERMRLDDVALLATSGAIVGADRAIAAARRALGESGLADLLPVLEPAALPRRLRKTSAGAKVLLAELRQLGAERAGVESVELVKLRRVSIGDLVLAAGTILGVYLLIGELAGVDYALVFNDAQWGWVAVAFLISPLPQLTGAIALKGAVSAPLPTGPVIAEQFANNFTGLIGGTLATTALVVRFFQKQGLPVAVAASSGIINSLGGFVVQACLVVIGVAATSSDFTLPKRSGGGGGDTVEIAVVAIIVVGVLLGIVIAAPKLRARIRNVIEPQWRAGRDNLRGIMRTPRKAAMLFGGNLASQLLFALAIEATLHAFGYSLPLLQIVVINSFASFLGGAAPVPGGMGVVEAGLIAGFTAAGIPDAEAVAATFVYRLFTAYLPPIWGWFSLAWLRRHEYV